MRTSSEKKEETMSLTIMFFIQVVQIMVLFVFLKKMGQLQKQINAIIDEVKEYIQFVTEEEEVQEQKKKVHHAEEQSQILHAVLGEYFP